MVTERRISIIEGIIKSEAPKINLQITALRTPIMAGIWFFTDFHWLINITTNKAVRTNSNPRVSN